MRETSPCAHRGGPGRSRRPESCEPRRLGPCCIAMRIRPTTRLTLLFGTLLAAALITGPAPAQQPDPVAPPDDEPRDSGKVEEVEVRLVQLPIIAQDRNGNPVTDLTMDEIVVKEGGKKLRGRLSRQGRARGRASGPGRGGPAVRQRARWVGRSGDLGRGRAALPGDLHRRRERRQAAPSRRRCRTSSGSSTSSSTPRSARRCCRTTATSTWRSRSRPRRRR